LFVCLFVLLIEENKQNDKAYGAIALWLVEPPSHEWLTVSQSAYYFLLYKIFIVFCKALATQRISFFYLLFGNLPLGDLLGQV